MESELINSFLNISFDNALSFDFVVNEHFANDVSFHRYNPFNNGHVISFLLATLSSMIGNHYEANNPRQIDSISVGMLGNNDGMKTVTAIINKNTA
uniref:Uncharacterized protein n=1 Tax=Romanomermis culicivorax TaxID=13658 RepID=A0A915HJW2_ROMCU